MDSNHKFPPKVRTMLEEAVRQALTGKGDSKILQQITVEADRIRVQVLREHGVLNIGVPSIRALRNGNG